MSNAPARVDVLAIPVGQLFALHGDRYSIPLYQRNYTWGEEQIHRLIYDVLDEAERDDPNDYFLGNLVVAPPNDSHEQFDVIDGQQRLTTLYILLTRLRRIPAVRSSVGELQPLVYEARDKATLALRGLVDGRETDEEVPDREDSGILRAVDVIDLLLNDPTMSTRFLKPEVIDYLLQRVLLVRMPIDRTTDLNRYFEVMNTRGAQLSPVDIVKARLLRHLSDPTDRALLNHVWTACSDMEHYVVMTATSGSTELRADVFGPDWQDLPTADFSTLRALLVERDSDFDEPAASAPVAGSSTALTFSDALASYARTAVTSEEADADGDDRFTSQITFPTLLLHVLALRQAETSTRRDDRQLDDKMLVSRFSDQLSVLAPENRPAWVRQFTTDLLRIRCLFDAYVLKRDATLSTGHESTTDDEPGSWSLYRISRGQSRSRGTVRDTPRYRPTFAEDEPGAGPKSLQRRILLLQSALRITYTSPRTMHWITDVLRYVTRCADRGVEVTPQGLLDQLESFARARVREALELRSGSSNATPVASPDGLPVGFALPRIVFTYLDYLLVDEMDKWDFTFAYRTSLEHFSPQLEDFEHASEAYHVRDRRRLDWLGNLALVTVSANSKFSNYLPSAKAHNDRARRLSLKLDLMAEQALAGSWNDEDIEKHHTRMVKLLREDLANRPVTGYAQDLPPTQTERDTQ